MKTATRIDSEVPIPGAPCRTSPWGSWVVFFVVFAGLHGLMGINIAPLVEDMIHGNGSADTMLVKPRYGFMRLPGNELTERLNAEGRLAVDFAQIYFPVRNTAELAYTKQTLDPFGRPSRFAPLVHHACAWTICRLDYGPASVAHVAIQYLVFLASLCAAFRILDAQRFLPAGLLLANACLFLLPVGLAWMERGQFSLYVAAAYLWLIVGMVKRSSAALVLSVVLAYAKLTSVPFMMVGFGVSLASLRGEALRWGIRMVVVLTVVLGMLFAVYFQEGVLFLRGALRQEYLGSPEGLTMLDVGPRFLVKTMPFIFLAAGVVLARRRWPDLAAGFPFLVGAAIILTLYPTKAYDYSVPSLLGFIPLLCWWAGLPGNSARAHAPVFVWGYVVFVVLTSLSGTELINHLFADNLIVVYLAFGALFIALSLFPSAPRPRGAA